MTNNMLKWLFGNAFRNGLFQINAGTYRTRYKHPHNPKLNRSRHWPFAESYQKAREASPSSRPVR